jgi:hypothetical protein
MSGKIPRKAMVNILQWVGLKPQRKEKYEYGHLNLFNN